jgi:hypothetical protein
MPTKGVKGALLGGEFEDGSHFEVSKIIRSDEYLGQKYKSPDNTTNLTVSTSALD